jgi:hypothetical protein
MASTVRVLIAIFSLAGLSVGCGGGVNSEEQARRAYLGLDRSIDKSLRLGLDGFNFAQSATIAPQSTAGDYTGRLTITGQVHLQGPSANNGVRMRLYMAMINYSEGPVAFTPGDNDFVEITYQTLADVAAQPSLQVRLDNIPDGDFTGTLDGTYRMSGDLGGDVTLNVTMSGSMQDDGTGKVQRVLGSTIVSGSATAGAGTYAVNLTL